MSESKKVIQAFVLGLLLGGAIVFTGMHFCRHFGAFAKFSWHRGEPRFKRILDRLSRKLDLSTDQKGRVEQILQSDLPKFKALRETMRPQFEAIRKDIRAQIRAVLAPEQQAKYDKMMEDFDRKRQEREKRWEAAP